jgi:Xaa-Pro aminopeptidase
MKILVLYLSIILLLPFSTLLHAESDILSMRDRAKVINAVLDDRLSHLLPKLMRREGIDMWILISREYNEDPILKTMLPANWLSARRRTILVLFDQGPQLGVERLAVARYNVDSLFRKSWDKEQQPNQWQSLATLIQKRNPKHIAINKSEHFALADGLTATEYAELQAVLSEKQRQKLISSEPLALAWLETRSQMEMDLYPAITKLGHQIIAQAFSNEVVTAGKTTTDDVVWWLREKVAELKLQTWFHPSVSIQRASPKVFDHVKAFSGRAADSVVQAGDLLHLDFGISYLRLHSDQQQHAYVLKPGELQAPDELQAALARANQLQDILLSHFKLSRTGNDILKMSRKQAIQQGIKPSIYTHPIGYHGHGAGTTIGMWDSQGGVPVNGDYALHYQTAYSIELNAASFIESWNKEVRIMLEEQAYFDESGVDYMDGRQTQFHLIHSAP